ncbi:SGNH/GDSL hydrolase family protein [Megalodesulfovibrio gigas]|uniref:Putative GDSL-lipase n=1 Tax=Megalodesulfovibrio gigas (strain ATCC 19364 / DSM 1382 / NCIMB 9332 / VKM B-1759) TaxID=1121448 RepID=T2GD40_MEGG1|nr:GDSL-lipase [Megalodesulfovibrio gigas]AGW14218.1 putative GDSL-lipase [Megalodesulfovibrio gigas DSM 1382 = ATCC 19364]
MTVEPSPTPPRLSKARASLYGCILVVLVLCAVEGAARLLYVLLPKTLGLAVPPQLTRLDPELGWSLRPGAVATSKRTGDIIRYAINSKGLRDDETPYEKPAGTTRIVLLGDSRTFGFGVPIEKHYSMLMEGYLDQVECINLGVDGYGVDQELLSLRKEGFRYQPDIVMALVSHFGDERHLHDSRWGMGKPMFVLDENSNLVLTNSPVSNNAAWYVHARTLDRIASASRAYAMLRDLLLHVAHSVKPRATPAVAAEIGIPDGMTAAQWAHQQRLFGTALAILMAMNAECAAHNADFVLLTQLPGLHVLAEAVGLRSLDLSAPMRNSKFPLPDGLAHFNEAGNGVLAWEVVQYLQREGLVPAAP